MLLVPASELTPGMVLAKDLHGKGHRLLLRAGAALDSGTIRLLQTLSITAVYTHVEGLEDVVVEDVVSPEMRVECQDSVRNAMLGFQAQADGRKVAINLHAVEDATHDLVDQLLRTRKPVAAMLEMRDFNDRMFHHSVNTAILATMIAKKQGFNEETCKQLAMGMVFHDSGQMFLPREVVEKTGRLLETEKRVMEKHSRLGFQQMFRGDFLSPLSSYVVLRHHERIDGTGYPDGIPGDQLHPVAKIAAVTEAFDAMTSVRPYGRPMMPDQAIRLLLQQAGTAFDMKVLLTLVQHIAIYPTGSAVQLSTGEYGIVTATPHGNTTRPMVRLFHGADGRRMAACNVDLATEQDRHIVRSALSINELKPRYGARHVVQPPLAETLDALPAAA